MIRINALAILIVLAASVEAWAAPVSVVNTYNWTAADFVQDPNRPVIYASVPSQNSVAVIDTNTLGVRMVPIGSAPAGMALSPDGSRLYVANSGSSFVGVMDTQSLTALDPLLVPGNAHPLDVAAGTDNRLFVIGNGIQQIDATTGLTAGPTLGSSPSPVFVYSGTLEISPDRKTLYYGQSGLSPTTLYKIDASSANLSVLTSTTTGSNGHDVALNHAGTVIAQPNGAPYAIGLLRTGDLATLGTLQTGPYPEELAFSPDDKVAYTYTYTAGIAAFSTSTYLSVGPTFPGAVGNEMFVDPTGRYLFASGDTATAVYDTGRSVPEPAGGVVALVGAFGLLGRRRRA